ncbi:histone-like nucleoid-structuring protein Lsr2 [Streptomyces sp. Midd1]|uniref:histone-like nucleoid-structuring protein Lsr2 n=1 Tax=Streptomyces sp. Midd3 TaxID=3161191 RepID=UPI0034DB1448
MAQHVRVILLDDLANDDTTEASETIPFSLDGVDYEIDLNDANAHTLRARLKEFIQAGRVINKATSKRRSRAMTEPAGAGATLSRHQGGVSPDEARTWATQQGLIPKGQRGRLGTKYKDAYRAFQRGDSGPLDKLKQELDTDGTTPAAETQPASTPQQPPKRRTLAAVADPAHTQAPAGTEGDALEAEAGKHYTPLTPAELSPDAQNKKWANRTAHGCLRTDKVDQMTLRERINAINNGGSDRNLTILGMLAGIIPLKNDKVSFLSASATRLENLEMIRYAPASDHGWEITDFGRYAHQVHSMGA